MKNLNKSHLKNTRDTRVCLNSYFNMKYLWTQFPPLTVKGHRNNEVLRAQLTSSAEWSLSEHVQRFWWILKCQQQYCPEPILMSDMWDSCLSVCLEEPSHLSLRRQPCKRLTIKLNVQQHKKREKPQAPDQTLQSFCKSSIKLEP